VGDTGLLLDAETRERIAIVEGAYKPTPAAFVSKIHVLRPVKTGDKLIGVVDRPLRAATMRNHTATHLLQAALRQVLGSHVKQAGSVVEPGRLRFDFHHYAAMTPDELQEVEAIVNREVLADAEVKTDIMALDQALSTGAMALFGEKYGESVRVVSISDFSRELCGGTHVRRTGEIGLFKIIYEGSSAAGIRRIEAITGEEVLHNFRSTILKLNEEKDKLAEQQRTLERQVDQLKTQIANQQIEKLHGRTFNGSTVIAEKLDGLDSKQLRTIADSLRNKWGSAVIVIAAVNDGSVSIISAVSKDLTGKVQAGKLVGELARAIGGKGGGRPDMAEGAGKDAGALPAALAGVYEKVGALL
jgi:alanyl-tRNA synthetase